MDASVHERMLVTSSHERLHLDEEKNTKNKKSMGFLSKRLRPFSRMNMRFCLMIRIILKKKIGF